MISFFQVLLGCVGLLGLLLPRSHRDGRRILVLAPGSLREARRKGVEHQLADYACGDYFEQVVFYHFHLPEPCCDNISERVLVEETAPLRFLGPLNLFRYLWVAIGLVRRHRITLIRSTDPYYRGLLGALLAKLLRLPFCISIHADYDKCYELDGVRGAPEVGGSRQRAKALEALVLRQADMVLPIRESLVPFVVQAGVSASKIHVIPHGLDLTRYSQGWDDEPSVSQLFSLPLGRRIISFVGRLSRENYVYDVVKIAAQLRELGYSDLSVVLAGDGPERARLEEEIRRHNLGETIRLVGFQPAETVCALRRQSYVNLALMGGFSLIEACASGRPVISYDIEWHYELVLNSETGFLVAEGVVDEATERLAELLDQQALAELMGEKAARQACERHDLKSATAFKIVAYEKLFKLGSMTELRLIVD